MPDVDQKTTEVSTVPIEKWREDLLIAKAAGADDESAAQYAGLTPEEFERHLQEDPRLEVDMLRARAQALHKHLQWIEGASQWQAHEFLLKRFWPEMFSEEPPKARNSMSRRFGAIFRRMSPDQARRSPQLLEEALKLDQARKQNQRALQGLSAPCPTSKT